jgi:hypothetical protein
MLSDALADHIGVTGFENGWSRRSGERVVTLSRSSSRCR